MKIRVAFVCWGNICRSTLSESVFTYKVKEKGLSDQFVIDSFATSTEEIGNPPHRGTVNKPSNAAICLDSVGWVICNCSAAFVKLCSFATVKK